MDGTLTVPNLDFGEMYRQFGVDRGDDILEVLQTYSPERRQECFDIIQDMERVACETMELIPYCQQTLRTLHHQEDCKAAICTRNTPMSVEYLLKVLGDDHAFDEIVTRESEFPAKPNPAAMQYILNQWKLTDTPSSVCMVGDSLENDVVFGKAAGVTTVLLDSERNYDASDFVRFKTTPDIHITCMSELPERLAERFELPSITRK